jgi:hypothetical protein
VGRGSSRGRRLCRRGHRGSARRNHRVGRLPSLPTFSPGSAHNENTERSITPAPGRAARDSPGTNGERRSGFATSDPFSGVSAGITEPRELRNIPGPPNRGSVGRCKFIHRISAHPLSQQCSSGSGVRDRESPSSVNLAAPGPRAPPRLKAGRRGRGRRSCAASVSRTKGHRCRTYLAVGARGGQTNHPREGPFTRGGDEAASRASSCRAHAAHAVRAGSAGRASRHAHAVQKFRLHRDRVLSNSGGQLLPPSGRTSTLQREAGRGRRKSGLNAQVEGERVGELRNPGRASPACLAGSAPSQVATLISGERSNPGGLSG